MPVCIKSIKRWEFTEVYIQTKVIFLCSPENHSMIFLIWLIFLWIFLIWYAQKLCHHSRTKGIKRKVVKHVSALRGACFKLNLN
jgi:hypothetical protein